MKATSKFLYLFMILAAVLSFTACSDISDHGESGNITDPQAALEAQTEGTEDPITDFEESTEPEPTKEAETTAEEPAPLLPASEIFSYPSEMALDDIYADVQTKAWVVLYESDLVCGGELWNEFYDKVSRGEAGAVLIANYFREKTYGGTPEIYLKEISFDGNTFKIIERTVGESTNGKIKYTEAAYKYLVKYDQNNKYVYILVHDNTYTYDQLYNSLFYADMSKHIDFERVIGLLK